MSRETKSASGQPFDNGKNVSNSALRRGPRRGRSHSVTFSLSSDNTNPASKRLEMRSSDSSTISSSRHPRSESITEIPEELINKDIQSQQSAVSRTRSKSYSNISDLVSNQKRKVLSPSEAKKQLVLPVLDIITPAQPSSPTIGLVKGLDSDILDIIAKERSSTPQTKPKPATSKPILPNIKPVTDNDKSESRENSQNADKSSSKLTDTENIEGSKEEKVATKSTKLPEKSSLQRRYSEQFPSLISNNSPTGVETRNAASADGVKRKILSSAHRRGQHGDSRKHVVSFKPQTLKIKRDHEIMTATYNEDKTKRTIEIQTEWSWMEDWKLHTLVKGNNNLSDEEDSPSIYSPELRQHRTLAEEALANVKVVDDNDAESSVIPEEAYSRHNTPSSTISSQKVDTTSEISDAFGVLTMELSSDSSDEDDNDDAIENRQDPVPAVGPPAILKYNRESEEVQLRIDAQTPMTAQSVASFHSSIGDGKADGICDYCGLAIIKEFPTMEEIETTPAEKLFCCPDYHQFVLFLHELDDSKNARGKLHGGSGTEGDGSNNDSGASDVDDSALINVSPHAPFKNRQARREAKERAQEKMRERERERQLANAISNLNYYAFARQIKTINYTLSSNRCIEEGWTVIPSPLPDDDLDADEDNEKMSFMTELPSNMAFLQQKAKGNQLPIQKFYENGNLFLLLLPDGTGSVFYPSGNVAIGISGHGSGLSYVVLEDAPLSESQKILALFNPSGHSCMYHSNNRIRMLLYPTGGEVADSNGTRKKKWNWDIETYRNNNKAHVHAPPFQPICFAITKDIAVRCLWQDKVYLSFTAQARSCKFNTGVKLKLIDPQQPPELSKSQKMELENEEFLNSAKKRIRKLLSKTQTTLKYPKSPRLEQLAPPRYLESDKQKHRPRHHLQPPKTPAGRLKEDDNVSVTSAISVEN